MLMSEVIKLYKDKADMFSLTTPYNKYDLDYPFGRFKLDQNLADEIIAKTQLLFEEESKIVYSRINKQKYNLPPFEEFMGYINTINNVDLTNIKDGFELVNRSLSNRFNLGQLNFKKPSELWHIFHNQDFLNRVKFSAMNMSKLNKERPLNIELLSDENKCLNNSLIKVDLTHIWHCTVSAQLNKVFYFKLNDDTIKWLLQHKNIYDLRTLDDLAFYKDDKLLFSSCTHEGFYNSLD